MKANICFDSEYNPSAIRAVEIALHIFQRKLRGIGGLAASAFQFQNDLTINAEGQVDSLATLQRLVPWHEGRLHVLLTDRPLFYDDLEVAGGAAQALGAAIISTAACGENQATIAATTIHEVGHAFGLVPAGSSHHSQEINRGHCVNRCAMQDGATIKNGIYEGLEALRAVALGYGFCDPCSGYLERIVSVGPGGVRLAYSS